MDKKLLTAGVIVAIAFSLFSVMKPARVVERTIQAGSVSSPDIMSPYFSFGGLKHWAGRTDSLTQATTTVCAIQSPAATSTLAWAGVLFKVSSTTASIVTLATSTSPYATTTLLIANNIGANAQGYVNFQGSSANVLAPNTWVVVGMAGGTGTFSPTGTCQAEFMALE